MPNFKYQAIDKLGSLKKGSMVALTEADLEKRINQSGLTLIKCKLNEEKQLFGGLLGKVGGKVQPRMVIEFYFRMAQTLELGLPILTALDENAKSIPSKPLKKVTGELRVSIESGNTLFEGMTKYPKTFGKLDIGIVRMGEQAGVLPKAIKDLAHFLEWKEDIRSTIKSAAMYPTFIIITICAVLAVWVGYVLPMMAKMLKDLGIKLPTATRVLLAASDFLRTNWLYIIVGVASFIAIFIMIQKTKKGAIFIQRYLLKIPVIGNVITNIALARLGHNFATMYSSGMNLGIIFDILTDDVIGNRYLEIKVAEAYKEIQKGQSIAGGFEHTGCFPPLFIGALRNGELTGTLDASLKRLGDYYDVEVKRSVKTLIAAIEPMTLLILGGVFGMIILSILLPLYDVMGNIGKSY